MIKLLLFLKMEKKIAIINIIKSEKKLSAAAAKHLIKGVKCLVL